MLNIHHVKRGSDHLLSSALCRVQVQVDNSKFIWSASLGQRGIIYLLKCQVLTSVHALTRAQTIKPNVMVRSSDI